MAFGMRVGIDITISGIIIDLIELLGKTYTEKHEGRLTSYINT